MKIVYAIQKSLELYLAKNFISVHDTSLVKYRVYNEMYARTRMVSHYSVSIRPPVKVPKNTVAVDLLINSCDFIVCI